MNKIKLGAVTVAFASLVAASNATVIFDQLGTGGTAESLSFAAASQQFAVSDGFGTTYDTVAVDDFTTTQTWHLTNVSFGLQFFNNANAVASGITGYTVDIYSSAAGTTANEPLAGDVLSASLGTGAASVGASGFAGQSQGYLVSLDLSSLNFNLAAGSYWVGVYMQNPYQSNGQTGVMASTLSDAGSVATNARQINPGGGFGLSGNNALISDAGANVNLSYQLSGSAVPEPASLAVLGLGALALIRRRRNKA